MSTKKYRSYGVRRNNNLSDLANKEVALNNLLDDLPGVDPNAGITFISSDLDPIRGLKNTDIVPESFIQIAGTAPTASIVLEDGSIQERVIEPRIRLEDRIRQYRTVTENIPTLPSGMGPKAYFIPSTLIPTFDSNTKLEDSIEASLANSAVQTSDDFWILGEFIINDRFRLDFPDVYGGILWEGIFIPNPSTTDYTFSYFTNGLLHIEYDRLGDGENWEVVKSIYAKKRSVVVKTSASDSTEIELDTGEARYISVGDFIDANVAIDDRNSIVSISGDTITLTDEITVTEGDILIFDMDIGETNVSGSYNIPEILDRAEIPQIQKRIFWWYPEDEDYVLETKYLRFARQGRNVYDYFLWNANPSSLESSDGSIRNLLENAVTPNQDLVGSDTETRAVLSRDSVSATIYEPKSTLSSVSNIASVNISFVENNRYIRGGNLSASELGNYIVPTTPADLGVVIPKNLRIKALLGSNVISSVRLVDQVMISTQSTYSVRVIDHNGLVDYFVASSSGTTVTVDNTSKLRKGMVCITGSTGASDFIRITDVISETQFTTSDELSLTDEYLFIYSDSGLIDRSLEVFCAGVFGQVLATEVSSGTSLELVSASGVAIGQVIQFDGSIPAETTVTDVTGNIVTISNSVTATIKAGSTIVFAPSGTTANKEVCVLPLDLSPPFIGVSTGLSTGGKNITSSEEDFNVKVLNLSLENTSVATATITETVNRKIAIVNNGLSILARKI